MPSVRLQNKALESADTESEAALWVCTGQRLVDDGGALKNAVGEPLASCLEYKTSEDWDSSEAITGLYWISGAEETFRTFCEMSIAGGGWQLVLQASSRSDFRYGHEVFTSRSPAGPVGDPDPSNDADVVSPAWWSFAGTETMLCMAEVDERYCNAWQNQLTHQGQAETQTASYMVQNSRIRDYNKRDSQGHCPGVMCNLDADQAYPDRLWAATTAFDNFQPYSRTSPTYARGIGYVNDEGTRGPIRIGWGADGDGGDSHDTAIGIGLQRTYEESSVDGGSGYFMYHGWTSSRPLKATMQGFVFVRNSN